MPTHRLTHSPDGYIPRTLRADLERRGRLPLDECIALGLSLTRALGFLHAQRLVHRDIKPSNVIFVGGVPKLADVGLVAGVGEARSYVGTEGFIPPEGPGSPQADLYSLGIVLYVMSTGQRQEDFPEPLPDLAVQPDHDRWLEFSAVIHKACRAEVGERYQSAEQMQAELELLQRRESVRRKQAADRRLASAKKLFLGAAALAVLVAASWLLSSRFNPSTIQRSNASTPPAPLAVNSLAVLPFVLEEGYFGFRYFSEGLADEIRSVFTNVPGLGVVPRTAILAFDARTNDARQFAEQLGAQRLIFGMMRAGSENLHITVRVSDVREGSLIWERTYNGSQDEFGIIGGRLARELAAALGVPCEELAVARVQTNLARKVEAHRLLARAYTARVKATRAGFHEGVEYLNRSLLLDPTYARAYQDMGWAYLTAADWHLPAALARREAEKNFRQALALEPIGQRDCLRALPRIKMEQHWDWTGAETDLKEFLAKHPRDRWAHFGYASYLRDLARVEEAHPYAQAALDLHPGNREIINGMIWQQLAEGQYQPAIDQCLSILQTNANDLLARWMLARGYRLAGRYAEASEQLVQARVVEDSPDIIAEQAYAYALMGQRAEAMQLLADLEELSRQRHVSPLFKGQIYAGLADQERMFVCLEEALAQRSTGLYTLKTDPIWQPFRSDPRFRALLRKMGLED